MKRDRYHARNFSHKGFLVPTNNAIKLDFTAIWALEGLYKDYSTETNHILEFDNAKLGKKNNCTKPIKQGGFDWK